MNFGMTDIVYMYNLSSLKEKRSYATKSKFDIQTKLCK